MAGYSPSLASRRTTLHITRDVGSGVSRGATILVRHSQDLVFVPFLVSFRSALYVAFSPYRLLYLLFPVYRFLLYNFDFVEI